MNLSIAALAFLSFAGWRTFLAFVPAEDDSPSSVFEGVQNVPFWCWWAVALVGLQVCIIGQNIPPPFPSVAFLASLPAFYVLRAVFRVFDKLAEKQSQNKTKKSSVKRLIAFVGFLFLVGAIWGLVSLHVWIYIFSGVAVFYILSHLKNKPKPQPGVHLNKRH